MTGAAPPSRRRGPGFPGSAHRRLVELLHLPATGAVRLVPWEHDNHTAVPRHHGYASSPVGTLPAPAPPFLAVNGELGPAIGPEDVAGGHHDSELEAVQPGGGAARAPLVPGHETAADQEHGPESAERGEPAVQPATLPLEDVHE